MDYGKKAVLRRKSKDLKKELKEMKQQLLVAGCDRGTIGQYIREFGETLELGALEREAYEDAKVHLNQAREIIRRFLDCIGENTAAEVENSLSALAEQLDGVYHDCLIRADDLDFKSTIGSLKQMIRLQAEKSGNGDTGKKTSQMSAAALQGAAQAGMSDIMLRSELENIKAVLDDTVDWNAPDFFALAYYFLHEEKNALKAMENQQRNEHIMAYMKIHFMDGFLQECGRAHAETKVSELIQRYV